MNIIPLTIMAPIYTPTPEPSGITLLPLSSWTIAPKSSSTITITNSNTININGTSNWNELIYTRFQPSESGTYTFNISWSAPSGLDFWSGSVSNRKLGVWFDTSLNISNNGYEGNRNQGILMYDSDNTSAISLSQTGTLTLDSSTNYYVWMSLGTLEDYKLQIISFTEMSLTKV